MSVRCFPNIKRSGKLASALLAVILCANLPASFSRASSLPDEWDEVFDTARAVLARVDAGRIDTIKDQALREAVRRAYLALKACAKVNKNQSRSIKQATVAEFERAFKDVEKGIEVGEYQACAAKCKAEGAECEKGCASARKKICGCKMNQFGCVVTRCLFS